MEPRPFVFSTISTLILFKDKNETVTFKNPARSGFDWTHAFIDGETNTHRQLYFLHLQ
jgi:hypothetical protein